GHVDVVEGVLQAGLAAVVAHETARAAVDTTGLVPGGDAFVVGPADAEGALGEVGGQAHAAFGVGHELAQGGLARARHPRANEVDAEAGGALLDGRDELEGLGALVNGGHRGAPQWSWGSRPTTRRV